MNLDWEDTALTTRFDGVDPLPARFRTRVATAVLATIWIAAAGVAWPQTAPPSSGVQGPAQQEVPARPAPNEPAPPTAQPAPEENPGLINELGRLWDKSKSMLPTIKSPQETIEDLNARARDAGESLSRIARPALMVTGRMICPVSGNGAPDCKAGADKLCQSKGHKEGKSLDTDAAEKCSAKVYLPGHKREPGDCRTENYVTRALCQ
jgi:hypothetical protein